jgi:TPR repeat protein
MVKRLFSAALIICSLIFIQEITIAQQPSVSEEAVTRPDKGEIIPWMIYTAHMSEKQQNEKLAAIYKNPSESAGKTPRSDFMTCVGLAYWGNAKAQQCVALAYEKSRGIVEDFSEAYAWYALAVSHKTEGSEENLERIKTRLVSVYPAPTDDDLDAQVASLKNQILKYQTEANK